MAIVITIMVIDLHSPAQGGLRGYIPLLPYIAVYVAGFLQIACLWTAHNYFFSKVEHINSRMLLANFGFLLLCSLTPVSILGISNHPRNFGDGIAFLLLGWVCLQMLTLFRLAAKQQHAGDPGMQAWHRRRNRTTFAGIAVMAVIAAIMYLSVAAGMSLYAAMMIWVLTTL